MKNYKIIEIHEYELMLREISESESIDLKNFDLLIYGGGGQDKRFYLKLKTNPKYEVLWYGWPGPKWSAIFSFIPLPRGVAYRPESSTKAKK